jgi:hypothetical protein
LLRLSVIVLVVIATVSVHAEQNATHDVLDTGISMRGLVKLAPQDHENGTDVAFMFSEGSGGKATVFLRATFDAAFPPVGKPAQKGQELTAAMFHNLLHAAASDSYVSLRFADLNPALQRGEIIKGLDMVATCAVDRVDNQLGSGFRLQCLAGNRKVEAGIAMNFVVMVVDTGTRLSRFLDDRKAVWVRLED